MISEQIAAYLLDQGLKQRPGRHPVAELSGFCNQFSEYLSGWSGDGAEPGFPAGRN